MKRDVDPLSRGAGRWTSEHFEGTWEEIWLHGDELTGRRVRVVILDAPVPNIMLDKALAHRIKAAEDLAVTLPQMEMETSVSLDAWAEGVVEKHRRQGFTL